MKSFWNKENYKNYESIKQDIKVDVCIIGGGLTGLSTAYYLSKNVNVAVVEKDTICKHTSGHTTGKITSQHGLFYDYLEKTRSIEYAKRYLEANEKAIDNIEKIVNNNNIECDFKREDAYIFTNSEKEITKIKREHQVVEDIKKGKSELVNEIELPLTIKSAIKFKNQAKFHPVKYAYGLCNAITKNGGVIYENSKALDIHKEGDTYVVKVNDNNIVANNVVFATRYPFISIPGYYFLKMYQSTSFAIVADVKEELFEGMYINAEIPTVSFRVIEQGDKKLLLIVGYDYKTGTDEMKNGYVELKKILKSMYQKSEILYKWSAEDCISLDKIPYIGEFSALMPNVYVATGFNKWGITSSNIAANIITDKILNKNNEYEELFESKRLEPIHNKDEVGNMLKEASKSLIFSKFTVPDETLKDVKKDQGKVVEVNGTTVGVYKDKSGKIYQIDPKCAHLGCELYFNNVEKIWECPCHGSKYTYRGELLEGPANKDLKNNM